MSPIRGAPFKGSRKLQQSSVIGLNLLDDIANPVAVALSPLRGTFPDGSLRAVGVQFTTTLTTGSANSRSYTMNVTGHNGTDSVACDVWRWDGNNGSVRISAGFPLKPGRLFESDIASVGWQETMYNSGSQTVSGMQNRAVLFPNNSQYLCDTFVALTPLKPEANEIADSISTFYRTASGTSRTFGEFASQTVAGQGVEGRTNGATYEHCHGFLCGAIRSSNATTRRQLYQWFYDSLYAKPLAYSTHLTADEGNSTIFARVGRGVDASLPLNPANTSGSGFGEEHWSCMMGFASGYLVTGWKQPWRLLCWYNNMEWNGNVYVTARDRYVDSGTFGGSVRGNTQRKMMSRMAAYVVGATMNVRSPDGSRDNALGRDNTTASWVNDMTWSLDALQHYQFTTANSYSYTDGLIGMRPTFENSVGGPDGGSGKFPTFQLSLVAKMLLFYYHNIDDDVRIPTWIVTLANFVAAQSDLASYDAGTYGVSNVWRQPYIHIAAPPTVSSPNYVEFAQSPMFAELMGAAYAITGNVSYKTWVERFARREQLAALPFTTKFVGEMFGGHQQSAKYYADGGSLRPIVGAHPTSISTPPTYTS